MQAEQRLLAGELWEDSGLVFTEELGKHLTRSTLVKDFKRAVAKIGCSETRFHDLRHPYVKPATQNKF